jgi:hypothetical protein
MIKDITVVTYFTQNHLKWLPHWMQQLNNQTVRGFKVLLIQHNWDDLNCIDLPHDLSIGLDSNIPIRSTYYYSEPNIGSVINYALSLVDTIYVAHWDVDDILHPRRFELQAKYLAEHPEVDFLNARCLGFIGEPKPEMLDMHYVAPDEPYADVTDHEGIRSCLLDDNKNCLTHGLMIYKRKVMERIGGFDKRNVRTDPLGRSPDRETWRKALMAGCFFHRLPYLLMCWNLASSSIRDVSNAKE